jgi:hypothetical protein
MAHPLSRWNIRFVISWQTTERMEMCLSARAGERAKVWDCVLPTAITPLGPASLFLALLLRGPACAKRQPPPLPPPPPSPPPPQPSDVKLGHNGDDDEVTTCLWILSSASRTACPRIPPLTVGEPSAEAASFLSNRTQAASSSRLGTYPISSPPSPSANPLSLQPSPLARRLVRSSNWAFSALPPWLTRVGQLQVCEMRQSCQRTSLTH